MTTTEIQLRGRGYAVWTSPTASEDADNDARVTSGIESHFLAKTGGWDDTFLDRLYEEEWDFDDPFSADPTYSYTEACAACGEVHPC